MKVKKHNNVISKNGYPMAGRVVIVESKGFMNPDMPYVPFEAVLIEEEGVKRWRHTCGFFEKGKVRDILPDDVWYYES